MKKKLLFVLAILTIAMFPHVIKAKDKPLKLMDGIFYEGYVNNKNPEGQGELFLSANYKMSTGYTRNDKAISIKGVYKGNEVGHVCVMDGYNVIFYATKAIYQINKKEKEISFVFKNLSMSENHYLENNLNSSFNVVYKYSKPYWEIKEHSQVIMVVNPISIGDYEFTEEMECKVDVDHEKFSFKQLSHILHYNDAVSLLFKNDGHRLRAEERGKRLDLDYNNFQVSSSFGSFEKEHRGGNYEKFSITAADGSVWKGAVEHTGYGDYDQEGRSLKDFNSFIKYSDGSEYEGTVSMYNKLSNTGLLALHLFKSQPASFKNIKYESGTLKEKDGHTTEFLNGKEKKPAPTFSKSYPIEEFFNYLRQKGSLTYTYSGPSEKMEGKRTENVKSYQVELGDIHYDCELTLRSDFTGSFTFVMSPSEQARQNQSIHLKSSGGHTRHAEYVQIFVKTWNKHNKVEGEWEIVDGEIHFKDRGFYHDFIVENNDVIIWDLLEPCRLNRVK